MGKYTKTSPLQIAILDQKFQLNLLMEEWDRVCEGLREDSNQLDVNGVWLEDLLNNMVKLRHQIITRQGIINALECQGD